MTRSRNYLFSLRNITTFGFIFFNKFQVVKENIRQQLGLFLDIKFNCLVHVSEKIKKVKKNISTIKKLSNNYHSIP